MRLERKVDTEEQPIQLTPALTAMLVVARTADAIYARLPHELQREIEGGCGCEHCKRDPRLARWDTLVVPTKADSRGLAWTHTVHMPDGSLETFRRYASRQRRP